MSMLAASWSCNAHYKHRDKTVELKVNGEMILLYLGKFEDDCHRCSTLQGTSSSVRWLFQDVSAHQVQPLSAQLLLASAMCSLLSNERISTMNVQC